MTIINLNAQYKINLIGAGGLSNTYLFDTENYAENNILYPSYSFQIGIDNKFCFKKNSINIEVDYILKNYNRIIFNNIDKYKYNYIIIPIYFERQKNKWFYNIGFTNNFSIKPNKIQREYFVKTYNISLQIGAGFQINNKIQIGLTTMYDIIPNRNNYIYMENNKILNGYFFAYNLMFSIKYNIFSLNFK